LYYIVLQGRESESVDLSWCPPPYKTTTRGIVQTEQVLRFCFNVKVFLIVQAGNSNTLAS
jgi:hypothetical protein